MTHAARIPICLLLLLLLPACSDDGGPSCSLDGGTQLASSAWPKFHADTANSGRTTVDLSGNSGAGGLLFPPPGSTPIGPTETTPILGTLIITDPPPEQRMDAIYLASSDGNVYVLDYDGQLIQLEDDIMVNGPVTGTPLQGADGTLFVPSNGVLAQFRANGRLRTNGPVPGFAAASPNIWNGDGTTYTGTLSGGFSGVCPNGVQRYQLSFPATQSAAAVAQDPNEPDQNTPIIVAAGLGGAVRAYTIRGRQRWSFFASSTVNAAVLIDESADIFYVADANGRVFAGDLAYGTLLAGFQFAAQAPISASPALGRSGDLYVADESGILYALESGTGAVRWAFQADGPITSSPAVATGGARDIIVVAADVVAITSGSSEPVPVDGRVYAIRDDGDSFTVLWTFATGASIGASSPAIYSDGTVYIGRQGQYLGTPNTPGCAVGALCNVGGGVFAIGPSAPAQ